MKRYRIYTHNSGHLRKLGRMRLKDKDNYPFICVPQHHTFQDAEEHCIKVAQSKTFAHYDHEDLLIVDFADGRIKRVF